MALSHPCDIDSNQCSLAVPPHLSFIPHPFWPSPPSVISRGELPVLTDSSHTGRGGADSGHLWEVRLWNRPHPSSADPGHHTQGSWYHLNNSDKIHVWLYFFKLWHFRHRFGVAGLRCMIFLGLSFLLMCNLICEPDAAPEHLVLKTIWNGLNFQTTWVLNFFFQACFHIYFFMQLSRGLA